MRIAFEKPTVIVTDKCTPFAFDISPIKHLVYPESLRFSEIVEFKEALRKTIISTADAANDAGARGYLQQFGPIKATELAGQTISVNEVAEDIRDLRRSIRAIEKHVGRPRTSSFAHTNALRDLVPAELNVPVDHLSHADYERISTAIVMMEGVNGTRRGTGDTFLTIMFDPLADRHKLRSDIFQLLGLP